MMDEHLPFELELIARIGWLIRLRWWAVVGTAAAVGVAALWFPGSLAVVPLLAVIAAIAAYNLVLLCTLRSLEHAASPVMRLRYATAQAVGQIVLDLVALTTLLHFSGGVENPMVLFFVFHVILASILLRPPVSYAMAGLATLLITLLAWLEHTGVVPHHHLPFAPGEPVRHLPYLAGLVVVLAFTLEVVAYLTTAITSRLRERDRDLYSSNASCQLRSAELSELNEQLRRMDAERSRFMVMVTHELRAPIATIYSALELVRGGYSTPDQTTDLLTRAQNRAGDLLNLISDLLNLSRIREQVVRPEEASPIDLSPGLHEVAEFVQVEATRNNITLEVDAPTGLALVRIRPDQAKLVWTNLLSNAIKYNRPGGTIRVSLRQEGAWVIGTLSDTGIGIPPADLGRVFDEFYRADNAKRVIAHGSGVGLATVCRILEKWGGTIRVESELGQGTTFTLAFPCASPTT